MIKEVNWVCKSWEIIWDRCLYGIHNLDPFLNRFIMSKTQTFRVIQWVRQQLWWEWIGHVLWSGPCVGSGIFYLK